MHLLLVRHGESVDNVAGLYAGIRDSPLTNHGVLQARRLGSHLASRRDVIGPISRVFASNLQRAYETAGAVAEAQSALAIDSSTAETGTALSVTRLADLREKDFGSFEGKKYGSSGPMKPENAESREVMTVRVNRFIDGHLIPLFQECVAQKTAVLVVSHGIVLNVLTKTLVSRFPGEATASSQPPGLFSEGQHSVAWSNTGVLQAEVELAAHHTTEKASSEDASLTSAGPLEPEPKSNASSPHSDRRSMDFAFTIQCANNIDHLAGLKKTRGGIGSAGFDSKQRTMDSFFKPAPKKQKTED